MSNPIAATVSINADGFINALKELQETLERIETLAQPVSIAHTITLNSEGDNSNYDIEKIMANISKRLEQQIVSSKSVYDKPKTTLKAESKITPEGKVAVTINIDEDAIGRVTTDEFERSIQQCIDGLRNQTVGWRCLK